MTLSSVISNNLVLDLYLSCIISQKNMQWNHCSCFTHTPEGEEEVWCADMRSFQIHFLQVFRKVTCVTGWVVPDILKETVPLSADINQSTWYCLIPEDEGTMILWNIRRTSHYAMATVFALSDQQNKTEELFVAARRCQLHTCFEVIVVT
jgi:hypothetical protein